MITNDNLIYRSRKASSGMVNSLMVILMRIMIGIISVIIPKTSREIPAVLKNQTKFDDIINWTLGFRFEATMIMAPKAMNDRDAVRRQKITWVEEIFFLWKKFTLIINFDRSLLLLSSFAWPSGTPFLFSDDDNDVVSSIITPFEGMTGPDGVTLPPFLLILSVDVMTVFSDSRFLSTTLLYSVWHENKCWHE